MANLRIIYNNLVDLNLTTLTASSEMSTATTPAANLENDLRGRVWRSATSTTSTVKTLLLTTFSDVKRVHGVVLVNTNNSPAATMTVYGYTGTPPTLGGTVDAPTVTGGTLAWTEGPTLCCPPAPDDNFSWGDTDYNAYQDNTVYSRLWIPTSNAQVSTVVVEVNDTITSKYLQASRLVIGSYWSPTYNTGYGMVSDYKDMSRSERAESGALITSAGARYATMQFNLDWMNDKDRIELNRLNRIKGTSGSIFVSLFPDQSDDWNLEQMYQIYGRLANTVPVTHPMYDFYSSSMDIEEV